MFDKFKNVKEVKVLVIGDLILDKYIYGKSTRISPEAPVPILLAEGESHVLGGAANVASNIIKLGAEAILIGCVGQDSNGKILVDLIHQEIGSTTGVIKTKSITTTKTRIISQNHQMLRIDEEDVEEINNDAEMSLYDIIYNTILQNKVSGIILQDYNKGLLTESLIDKIIILSKENQIPFFVDPKHKNFWNYKGAALYKPNLSEILSANNVDDKKHLEEILINSADKLDCKILMCTLAENGIAYVENSKIGRTPTQKIDILDVSGAGDSALSVMVLAYLLGYDSKTISILANLCGKVVCMKSGVSTVTIHELKDAFRSVHQDNVK